MRRLFGFFKRSDTPEDPSDPRAEELRRRLEESRALVGERDEFEAAEPTVEQTEHAPDDPERRRREVHETGRTVAQQMRRR